MTTKLQPFHLAIPVDDLERAEVFYREVIGCGTGRRSARWVDLDFFGHQLVIHLAPEECLRVTTNEVDGKQVPARHFGIVLERGDWQSLADRLRAAKVEFIIEPGIRFAGEAGEQGTFFFTDPAGNALEFKYFEDLDQLFAA